MSPLPFEAFLALRYLRPRRTLVSVITLISVAGVTLGVGVLIIVISVMSGFDQEWRDRILGFSAHLKVLEHHGLLENYEGVRDIVLKNPEVLGAAPFTSGQVMIKTQPASGDSYAFAPIVRGVDPEQEGTVSVLPRSIVQGKWDLDGQSIIIGTDIARNYDIHVGDHLLMYSPETLNRFEKSARDGREEKVLPFEYTVRGIFDVGFGEYNSAIVVVSLESGQQLYSLSNNRVHGLQVMIKDPFKANEVRAELKKSLGDRYGMMTWREENPDKFNALAVEKSMMFYILFFIMIVAAFGIVNSQITFVVQKTREIGILKAIGATRSQVMWLFLSQSVIVGVLGVGTGLGFGLLALAYRNEFLHFMNQVAGFNLLPVSMYYLYELPAKIQTGDVVLICGTAFGACVLAGVFPAWKASRLQPVEALRHD
jgi:lipoprotein-releasing system permease protein